MDPLLERASASRRAKWRTSTDNFRFTSDEQRKPRNRLYEQGMITCFLPLLAYNEETTAA